MRSSLVLVLLAAACASPPAPRLPANATPVVAPVAPEASSRAKPWIAKLGDPRESERALDQLEQLGDPIAIPAIGEAWLAQGRPPRLLAVAIGLARPLTPAQAKALYLTDYEVSGRPASWQQVLPLLTRAALDVDESNPRSVDSAMKAVEALGEAGLGITAIIELASRPPSKKLIAAEITAIRALGESRDQKAVGALVALLGRDRPARTKASDEALTLYLATTGAAINALAQLHAPGAIEPLVLAMYRTPELFTQVRRALVASGPTVVAELRAVLRGKHAAVEALFTAKQLERACDDSGTCTPVSAKDFYAAVVLGDFYDASAVPELLAALARPALPVYVFDDQPSPNTQQNALFDALRKVGAPEAAAPLRALWSDSKADVTTRVLAVGAYPFVVRDATDTAALASIVEDAKANDQLRAEAATALARISRDAKDIAVFARFATKYVAASTARAKRAAALQPAAAAADRALDAAKAGDPSKLRDAKQKHRAAVTAFKHLDQEAKAYLGFARMFQTHAARVAIALRCKDDLACYAASLVATPADVVANVAPYLVDVASWSDDEKRDLVAAAIERAMLELGNRGSAASGQTDALLQAATSDVRLIRQSILLALPRIAPRPCDACERELDKAIRAGDGKASLADLQLETQVLRSYFAWAGRTP